MPFPHAGFAAGDDHLAIEIVGGLGRFQRHAAGANFFDHGGDVGGLHVSVARARAPNALADFANLDAVGIGDVRQLFGEDAEENDGFVKDLVGFHVMQEHERRAGRIAGHEDAGAADALDVFARGDVFQLLLGDLVRVNATEDFVFSRFPRVHHRQHGGAERER